MTDPASHKASQGAVTPEIKMPDDAELLRSYSDNGDESAFAELVQRHLGLVYHAALRQCGGDAHRAEDVAQSVFTDLARKAPQLARRPVLAGWLYTSTRYAAAQAVRTETRRQAREQEAHAMNEILSSAISSSGSAAEWERLRPVIDDALHTLGERDREAVLLRFFEGRTFADVGVRLSVSEDAARMRVERALDKLRAALGRRGVTSTAAALGTALASQVGAAAPAGLATSITGLALTGAVAGSGAVAITFMSMTKLKIGLVAAVLAAGAASIVVQQQANTHLRGEISALRDQNRQLAQLRAENERLAQQARATDQAEPATLKTRLAPESAAVPATRSVPENPVKPAFTLATGLKPAESFTNAGRETPRAALETLQWATLGGNATVIAEGLILPPSARQKAEELFAALPADKRVEFGTPDRLIATLMAGTTQVAGMQVMSEKPGVPRTWGLDPALATDPTYRMLHTQTQYIDGRVREGDVVLQQTSTGWHTVFPPGMVDKLGELLKPVPANLKHDGGAVPPKVK